MEDNLTNKYNLKMKKIMFLFVLNLLRRRSDYCHHVAIFYPSLMLVKPVLTKINFDNNVAYGGYSDPYLQQYVNQ